MSEALTPQSLKSVLNDLGFPVQETVVCQLTAYLKDLLHWNRAINLTGIKDWQLIVRKLIVDSLYLAKLLSELPLPKDPCICDLGAGAGLPGIPLRLLYTGGSYLMLEKMAKRAVFLRNMLARMDLPATQVMETDIRDFAKDNPGCADLVLSRAFLPFPKLAEAARPFLKDQGYLLVLSSAPFVADKACGWTAKTIVHYTVEAKDRWFWVLCNTDAQGRQSPQDRADSCKQEG
ncbi:MAG: 16S rRNA (guanine(527)-N(7))-methyltransferase RsmG [Desulfovibrio sp.]|nr:16S rRNA (guanine(527)-N(7))-methyltransferase RsmG [Desulfovibrio sp.]